MKQMAFYFDSSACSGCKTCQVACKDKYDLAAGVLWRRVYEVCGGDWIRRGNAWLPNILSYHVSLACNHCEEAICIETCPNTAIVKDEKGIVLIDQDRCMGCRYCEWSCPYGALQFDSNNRVMTKCTFCADYIEEGKDPACITACPMRAMDYGELEQLREKYGNNSDIYPLPDSTYTGPAIVVTPHRDSRIAGNRELRIINREEVKPNE